VTNESFGFGDGFGSGFEKRVEGGVAHLRSPWTFSSSVKRPFPLSSSSEDLGESFLVAADLFSFDGFSGEVLFSGSSFPLGVGGGRRRRE